MANHKPISERRRDLLLYLAIAISLVASVGIFALYQAKTGGSPDLPLKWLGFAAMSAIVFGYAIRNNRSNWTKSKFWGLLVFFAVLHFVLGFVILLRTPVVPMVFYGIATGIEYFVLALYFAYLLPRES
jgi:hypothetical protein